MLLGYFLEQLPHHQCECWNVILWGPWTGTPSTAGFASHALQLNDTLPIYPKLALPFLRFIYLPHRITFTLACLSLLPYWVTYSPYLWDKQVNPLCMKTYSKTLDNNRQVQIQDQRWPWCLGYPSIHWFCFCCLFTVYRQRHYPQSDMDILLTLCKTPHSWSSVGTAILMERIILVSWYLMHRLALNWLFLLSCYVWEILTLT